MNVLENVCRFDVVAGNHGEGLGDGGSAGVRLAGEEDGAAGEELGCSGWQRLFWWLNGYGGRRRKRDNVTLLIIAGESTQRWLGGPKMVDRGREEEMEKYRFVNYKFV